jgi:formylglycine-generating enzyme required for sulfatase activity
MTWTVCFCLLANFNAPIRANILAQEPDNRAKEPATKVQLLRNSIGMTLARIPAGEFLMGAADSDEDAQESEKPQHKVRITNAFYLGIHEVTVGQFRAFVRDTGHQTGAETDGKGSSGFNSALPGFEYDKPGYTWKNLGWMQDDDHPVLNVSWHDATAFCRWLSKKENKQYRLPTEAEWEYACRAGGQARFITGDASDELRRLANVQDKSLVEMKPRFSNSDDASYLTKPVPWDDGCPFSAPVGRMRPNEWGLYDMLGNAAEWCQDWHGGDYYRTSHLSDPMGPETGTARVVRGGAFCTSRGIAASRTASPEHQPIATTSSASACSWKRMTNDERDGVQCSRDLRPRTWDLRPETLNLEP